MEPQFEKIISILANQISQLSVDKAVLQTNNSMLEEANAELNRKIAEIESFQKESEIHTITKI